jgi:radical SAM superfamily enzyme YgiQ (UPF0313 family)
VKNLIPDLDRRIEKNGPLDLLLILCPPWDVVRPPMGLAYVASFMRRHLYNVDAWDLNIRLYHALLSSELATYWETLGWESGDRNMQSDQQVTDEIFARFPEVFDALVDRMLATKAWAIGFSLILRNTPFTERLAMMIKQRDPEKLIIYGGPDTLSAHSQDRLGLYHADAYVLGEGEATFLEALETYKRQGKLIPMPGLVLHRESEVSYFVPREPIVDLGDVPFPTYEEFDLTMHKVDVGPVKVPLLLSRGCTGSCAFCADKYYAGKFRSRPAKAVVREIRHHVENYGITQFGLNDQTCNGSLKNLREFCDELIEADLNVKWWAYAVVRKGMTPRIFEKMAAAGCDQVIFGIDSASDPVLKAMNKYYTGAMAEQQVREAARAGIRVSSNFMVGFPGETRANFHETLQFLKRNRDYLFSITQISIFVPSPGSPVRLNPENWNMIIDGDTGTWRTEDGNDYAERLNRWRELKMLIETLGLPLTDSVTEPVASLDAEPEAEIEVHEDPPITIANVTVLDKQAVAPGDPLTVEIEYLVERAVTEPFFRMQIYNREPPHKSDVFVYGTNTNRGGLSLGELSPGTHKLRVEFESVPLLPRTYRLDVGVLGSEKARRAFDEKPGAATFTVEGTPDAAGAVCDLQTTWDVRDVAGPLAQGSATIGRVRLLDGQGIERSLLDTGTALRVQTRVVAPESPQVYLLARLLMGPMVLHQARVDEPISPGESTVLLEYDSLRLLEGWYRVELALIDKDAGSQVAARSDAFEIRSDPEHGGGIVHIPARWEKLGTGY